MFFIIFLMFESLIAKSLADCPSLTPPSNAVLDRSCGTRVGNICRIYCRKNCQLVGDSVHQCLPNNSWSGSQTYCVDRRFRCRQRLSAPECGHQVGKCHNRVGSICVFACNTGYTLIGSAQVVCQRNGQWSARPTCVKSTTTCAPKPDDSMEDEEPYCPALTVPTNGYMRGSCDVSKPTAICEFGCNSGYQLVGHSVRVCKNGGKWTHHNVQCLAMQTNCPALSPPLNGVFYGNCDPGVFESKCNFLCNKGYQLVGTSPLTCQSNGIWSSSAPVCTGSSA